MSLVTLRHALLGPNRRIFEATSMDAFDTLLRVVSFGLLVIDADFAKLAEVLERSRGRNAGLPVLLTSAGAGRPELARLSVDGVLKKPLGEAAQLRAAVASACARAELRMQRLAISPAAATPPSPPATR